MARSKNKKKSSSHHAKANVTSHEPSKTGKVSRALEGKDTPTKAFSPSSVHLPSSTSLSSSHIPPVRGEFATGHENPSTPSNSPHKEALSIGPLIGCVVGAVVGAVVILYVSRASWRAWRASRQRSISGEELRAQVKMMKRW
ncbi:MAG: hypothetical protein DHS80DRAFT_22596 [Piptocephalis tieghemiana]|nr:MAG: hypothetical protein DHS80DRAFT_22596 [Piptocephalis tieghemiana]